MMLTLFTPAYNRAHTLPRLFESLQEQTCFDFEWLIVDDGSTDGTSQAVEDFVDERFPIRYIYKENGGKHTAYNRGLEEARGEWFLCVDSDDTLTPTAVADILAAAQGLPEKTGIASYKADLEGDRLSCPFPEGQRFSKMHRLSGEFAYAFPTSWAKDFPYPVFPGEKFIGECVVYDRMDREGQMLLLPKVTMPCEYQTQGLTRNFSRLMGQNPKGFCLYFLQRIDLAPGWKQRLVLAGKYQCFRLIGGKTAPVYAGPHRFTAALAWPLGLCFRLYYKLLRGF